MKSFRDVFNAACVCFLDLREKNGGTTLLVSFIITVLQSYVVVSVCLPDDTTLTMLDLSPTVVTGAARVTFAAYNLCALP